MAINIDATAQAITGLIDQKVDVLIVQNMTSRPSRSVPEGAAGRHLCREGMQSVVQTDLAMPALTGRVGKMAAAPPKCGVGTGKSGKVASCKAR